MKIQKLLFVLCLAVFTQPASGQKFDWVKYDSSLFKEDTVAGFSTLYTRVSQVANIKNSPAEIEIRYYVSPTRDLPVTTLYQVKYKDKQIEKFAYRYTKRSPKGNFEFVDHVDNNYFYRKKLRSTESGNDSLFSLIYANLLTGLIDQKKLLDSLRERHIEIYDVNHNQYNFHCTHCPFGYNYIEVKIGNKYRSFSISRQSKFYSLYNPDQKILKYYNDLYDLLAKYFEVGLF
jgi:hypothetical protein